VPYDFRTGASGTTSFASLLTAPLTVPKLVLKIQNLVPGKSHWVRAGYIEAVSLTNIGETRGKSQWVNFGPTEIEVEPPAYPYQLRFSPRHYVTKWAIEVYEKDKPGADGVAVVNAPTIEETELLNSLGLQGLDANLSPENWQIFTALLKATTEKGRYARTIGYTPSPVPVQVLERRADRSGATLYNGSQTTIYIGFDSSLNAVNAIEVLLPGGQWVLDGQYIGPIWMMASAAGDSLSIAEYANQPFS
jgi:hypothetical protein